MRNSYADLLRTVAIVAVVIGHWLATGVVHEDGRYVGVDALSVIGWGSWVTLLLQVIPAFFLVGGYANAVSWSKHCAGGEAWASWVRARVLRLLVPTCGYAGVVAVLVLGCQLFGVNADELAQAGWGLALHLWFLAAYAVVLLCTPALYAAHLRWRLAVPAVMATLAVLIDVGVVEYRWHLIGWANYLLVWGIFHQLGFAWHDGTFARRRRSLALAASAALVLTALIWWGPYPVSMVGVPGARIQNASPPSAALLAFGLAQVGVLLACEPVVTRWLGRHRRAQATIDRAGALTMPVYLWHMVPVVVLVVAGYPRAIGLPAVGSRRWWEQRPEWIAALVLVLAVVLGLLALVVRYRKRAMRAKTTPPAGRATAPRSVSGILIFGIIISAVGIGYLAVHGFARHGQLDPNPLSALAVGTLLVQASARRLHIRTTVTSVARAAEPTGKSRSPRAFGIR